MESQGTASFPTPGRAEAVAPGTQTTSPQLSPKRQAPRTGRVRPSFQELCKRAATSRNSRFLNMKAAKHVPYHYMNFYLNNNLTITSKKHGIQPGESKERNQATKVRQDSTLRTTLGSKLSQAWPAMENDYVSASLEATGSSAATMRTPTKPGPASAGGRATGNGFESNVLSSRG